MLEEQTSLTNLLNQKHKTKPLYEKRICSNAGRACGSKHDEINLIFYGRGTLWCPYSLSSLHLCQRCWISLIVLAGKRCSLGNSVCQAGGQGQVGGQAGERSGRAEMRLAQEWNEDGHRYSSLSSPLPCLHYSSPLSNGMSPPLHATHCYYLCCLCGVT